MLKFFLALRYLKKKKIVLLSIVAVALSTALLVTVASLFTAFIEAIELSSSDYLGDIVLSPPAEFSHSDELVGKLCSSKEIAAASVVLSTNGLVHLGPGNVKAVSIWGIDLPSRCEVTDMKNSLLRQKTLPSVPAFENDANDSDIIPAFVGIGLLAEPDVKTDEYDLSIVKSFIGRGAIITVGSVQKDSLADDSFAGLRSRSARIKICDVVYTCVYDIDKRFIFVPVDRLAALLHKEDQKPVDFADLLVYAQYWLREFIDMGADEVVKNTADFNTYGIADVIHIKCAAGFSPAETVPVVRRIWTDFAEKTLNWPHFYIADTEIITSVAKQSQYTVELRKQMGVLLVIFGVISAGVVVLVFCIFYMIVVSKQKDLAVIKSIGGSSFTSASIFLFFGLFIGLFGASVGLAAGYVITHNVNTIERWIGVLFGLKLWSSSVYMFSKIPNHFNWYWGWWFFGAAVLASVLGALVPAIAAAKTIPAKILRYE
jgi:ABC-type lipoprotein release transport system permease subunit